MNENPENKQDCKIENEEAEKCKTNGCDSAAEQSEEQKGAVNDVDKADIDAAASKRKKQKRNIIIIFASMLAFLALCLALPNIISMDELLGNKKLPNKNETSGTKRPIVFNPPKEPGFDIFEYEEYLGLDRNIYICNPGSGVTESVQPSKVNNYDEGFRVVYSMINAIIKGDVETYNALMGKDENKKDNFTQQQLYNIKITKSSVSSDDEDGKVYNKYAFYVEYMIHENNGSFRDDFGSDEIKRQYIVVTDKTGAFLVDEIMS